MPATEQLPEYLYKSVGQPAFGHVAIRLRDLAAFMAAQGMTEVAEQLVAAYSILRAKLASGQVVTKT